MLVQSPKKKIVSLNEGPAFFSLPIGKLLSAQGSKEDSFPSIDLLTFVVLAFQNKTRPTRVAQFSLDGWNVHGVTRASTVPGNSDIMRSE